MALIQDRLVAEASTAAWQDYFMFNAFLALLCLFPALPFWRREKYLCSDHAPAGRDSSRGTRTKHAVAVRLSGCFCQIDIIMGG